MKQLTAICLSFFFFLFSSSFNVLAFNMTVAPAKKVLELSRGAVEAYELSFQNDFESGSYEVRMVDFVYDEKGERVFLKEDELADKNQSLSTWVKLGLLSFSAKQGERTVIPIRVEVPADALYGDHFGFLEINRTSSSSGEKGLVKIGGSISSVLALHVLGGDSVRSGKISGYEVATEQRARNTANFLFAFVNTGNDFFTARAEVEVLKTSSDREPIKTVTRDFTSLPNVIRQIKIPLGDLGDDVEEGEYFSRLSVYETSGGKKVRIGMAEKSFQYFIPLSPEAELHSVAKEIQVESVFSQVVRELGIYIFGFLVVLIVFVRLLFRGRGRGRGRL